MYRLRNIRFSDNKGTRLKPNVIYAELVDERDGSLAISSTLEYIFKEILKRKYEVANVKKEVTKQGATALTILWL